VKQECCNLLHINTLSLLFPFHPPVRIFLSVSARVYETPGVKGEKVKSEGRPLGILYPAGAFSVFSFRGVHSMCYRPKEAGHPIKLTAAEFMDIGERIRSHSRRSLQGACR